MAGYKVAVVGATGAVGRQMLDILAARAFPVKELVALASARSAGKQVSFAGEQRQVAVLGSASFDEVQVALFSAGGSVSKEYAPLAAAAGAVVIDNTSAFRMDDDVPLVVPEVNAARAAEALGRRRIIANPNCSTIQMVVALEPLRQAAGLERIVVSTYQAVSGAGARAIDELYDQAEARVHHGAEPAPQIFPHPIFGECLPHIGSFNADGSTTEEAKMVNETRKIFELPKLPVCATTVRVPVVTAHSEAVYVQTGRPLSPEQARRLLADAPGVVLVDDPTSNRYPLARQAAGTDPVYVGRVRADPSVENGLCLWVVADNLRKGAALNAVQIAERLHERGQLS